MRRDGIPLWIGSGSNGTVALRRVDLHSGQAGSYDEFWLQLLLHRNPSILPVKQIDPDFKDLVSICTELPLKLGGGRDGSLDNLFITPDGQLVLVEAKLWRNPEARRSAVAQVMQYAAAVFRLSYDDLQTAVLRARASEAAQYNSLYDIVATHRENVDEPTFVDGVTRNLRRGRAIVAIVGDGIREDVIALGELLQSHAGHRFTFALVELAIYEAPQADAQIVVPSILGQTVLIERGVVQIEEASTGRIVVREPSITATSSPRRMSIGEDEFYELLEKNSPGSSSPLKSFLAKAEKLGFYVDRQGALNLKHASPNGSPLNVATIEKGGLVDTGPATWWGRSEAGRQYNDALASLIQGTVREFNGGRESSVRTAAGRMPQVSDFLPQHEEAWLSAIERYETSLVEQAKES